MNNNVHTYSSNRKWVFVKPNFETYKVKYGWIYGRISECNYREDEAPYMTFDICYCEKRKGIKPKDWFIRESWEAYYYETLEELIYNHFIDLL